MSNETLFFICGIALAVSAVLVSLVGLKVKDFPGKAFPLVDPLVRDPGRRRDDVRRPPRQGRGKGEGAPSSSRRAKKSKKRATTTSSAGGEGANAKKAAERSRKRAAKGPGGTLQLAANPTEIAYDKTSLSSKPGKVTIDFTNPAHARTRRRDRRRRRRNRRLGS